MPMTAERIRRARDEHLQALASNNIPVQRMDIHSRAPLSRDEMLAHAHYLLVGLEDYMVQGRVKKANRHLGSAQTLLRTAGWQSIADLMNVNRSTRDE